MRFDNLPGDKNSLPYVFLEKVTFEKTKLEEYGRNCFKNYIIYDNKQKMGYCTSCNSYFQGTFRKGDKTICPNCAADLENKAKGSFASYQSAEIAMTFRHKDGFAIVHCFSEFRYGRHKSVEFDNRQKIEKSFTPHQVNFFTSKGCKQWEVCWWWLHNPIWQIGGGMHQPHTQNCTSVYMDKDMLEKALKKSYLKYCAEVVVDREEKLRIFSNSDTMRLIEACKKYPKLEMLYKMGLYHIVESSVRGGTWNAIYWPGKTIESFLKIKDKQLIKLVAATNPRMRTLRAIQQAHKEGWKISTSAEIADLDNYYDPELAQTIRKYGGTVKELIKYRKPPCRETWTHKDYLRQAAELKYDLTDKYYLFPKDLKAAHDRVSKEYRVQKDKTEKRKQKAEALAFAETVKQMNQYSYMYKGLMVRIAQSYNELSNEGKILHHCVASYWDRMQKGKTYIFLIRQADSPNEPFYTLELGLDKHIIQCRGKNNCAMTPEVERFLEAWKMYIARADRKHKNKLTYEVNQPSMAAM